jgi:hypothetical protein
VETSQIVFLVFLGVVAVVMLGRKKKPDTAFFDVVEIIDVRPKRKSSRFLVNLLIVAGIGVFLWIMSRH